MTCAIRAAAVGVLLLTGPPAVAHAQPEQCHWTSDAVAVSNAAQADADLMLAGATTAVSAELHTPARLDPQGVSVAGDWGFLQARILGPDGNWIDYAGTPYADAMASKSYYALLKRSHDDGWALFDSRVGPTDALDQQWPQRFGSPAVFWHCS